MTRALLAAFLLSTAPALYADDAGTTSANFLKLGAGPRAVGMGEAQTAVADDAYATFWNPAGLAQLSVSEAAFAHTRYVQDITDQYAAYAHPLGRWGTVAGSVNYLGVGKFQGYDATGQPNGTVGASDVALGVSYGRALWANARTGSLLAAGGTLKYIQEKLDTVAARAYALDGGLLWSPGRRFGEFWEGWRAGLTVRNLGTSMTFDRDSFSLPRSLNAGLAWTGLWLGESLTIAVDGQQPNDGDRSVSVGAELWTLRTFVVRGGFTSRGDLGNGLRLGAGLRFRTVQIDYAFANTGDFGGTHRFGVAMRFGHLLVSRERQGQEAFDRGMRRYSQRRWAEALVDFNKALEIDPGHPQAYEMMQKTYEKLKEQRQAPRVP